MALQRYLAIVFLALGASAGFGVAAFAQEPTREVAPGGRVELAVTAYDADGDPLTYTWSTTGGRIVGSGPRVTFDATGLAAGTYTATVVVSDSQCEASKSIAVRVTEPLPPPAPESLGLCAFGRNAARVDNACKATLDDVALRLRQEPRLVLVVDGHAATGERAGVALRRAEAVRAYFVSERGVDPNRVVVRSFDDRCPLADAARNARVELFLLPEGSRVEDIRKNCP